MCKCDLCNNKYAEFTVTSKHLSFMLPKLKKYNKKKLGHITKHICDKCFIEIFREKKQCVKKLK
jgi:hypothetical protein